MKKGQPRQKKESNPHTKEGKGKVINTQRLKGEGKRRRHVGGGFQGKKKFHKKVPTGSLVRGQSGRGRGGGGKGMTPERNLGETHGSGRSSVISTNGKEGGVGVRATRGGRHGVGGGQSCAHK